MNLQIINQRINLSIDRSVSQPVSHKTVVKYRNREYTQYIFVKKLRATVESKCIKKMV